MLPLLPLFLLGQITLHGPTLGALTDHSVTVWCRLNWDREVSVLYGTDPSLQAPLSTARQTPDPTDDWTLHFQVDGLAAETRYYYALQAWQGTTLLGQTPTHSFQTAPPPGASRTFTFVVFADAGELATSSTAAYDRAGLDSPAFCLQIGDLDHRNPAEQGPSPVLSSWRAMHRDQLGSIPAGASLASVAGEAPLFHTWDDHDYGANNSDGNASWKGKAMRAYREYFPTPPLPYPDLGIFTSWSYGEADFFLLDCRYQRADDLLPDVPGKSMLGPVQLQWLIQGVTASTARWKFVFSSSCWNPHSKPVDSWALYQSEAAEIRTFLAGVPGVIWISGDIHSGGGIDDGANSFWPEITVPGTNVPPPPSGCTGFQGCGSWSEGVVDSGTPDGYARITVDPLAVTLQAVGADGAVRVEYVVP